MKKEDMLDKMSLIDTKYIEEAVYPGKKKRMSLKYMSILAACICLCLGAVVSVLAATNETAYEMLYSIAPGIAQRLKPVNVSCTDQGIEMQVIAAKIQDEKAEILISLKDTEGTRIDETIDLFDSYSIHTPHDQSGGCSLVDYDEETGSAIFLIQIEQINHELIPGDKITFSVGNLLTGKKHFDAEISEIDMGNLPEVKEFMINPNVRGASASGREADINKLIEPDDINARWIGDGGVAVTGWGIVDGKLHIQIRYEDILRTDNHGFLSLKTPDGEQISYDGSIAFWDDKCQNSYEEYIFETSDEEWDNCRVWGEFCTSNTLIEGKWQVTFPMESAEEK